MPIVVECSCGRRLKAGDDAAGKTARCPACGNPVTVPLARQAGAVADMTGGNPFLNPEWEMPATDTGPQLANPESSQPALATGVPGQTSDGARTRQRRGWIVGVVVAVALVGGLVGLSQKDPNYDGKPFSHWKKQLADTNVETRAEAVQAIGSIGRSGHDSLAIPPLLDEAQRDAFPPIRVLASRMLAGLAPSLRDKRKTEDPNRLLEVLIGALANSGDPEIAENYIEGIENIIRFEKSITPANQTVALQAVVDYLGKPGKGGKAAAVSMLEMFALRNDDAQAKLGVEGLGKVLDDDDAAAKAMLFFTMNTLNSENTSLPLPISISSNKTAVDVKPAMPYFAAYVKKNLPFGKTRVPQLTALRLLAELGDPSESVPALTYVVQNEHNNIFEAMEALAKIGPPARSAIPAMQRYMQNPRIAPVSVQDIQGYIDKIRN